MDDDGGVMGHLPRSRPGRRSEKRAGGDAAKEPAGAKRPGASAERAAKAAERRDAPAARQTPKSEPRRDRAASARRGAAGAGGRAKEAAPSPGGSDPVGDVIRTATKVAGTGVRVATGVAHEVLRRIPRP